MSATPIELLGLPYSPWSEQARWALEARAVPYRFVRYQPVVGELGLRLKLRQWTGTVTVPVLTDEEGRHLADSLEIARYADHHGEGPRLFPSEHAAAIDRLTALAARGMSAGRARSLARMLDDETALREMVPRSMHRLGAVATTIGRLGIARTLDKYGAMRVAREAHRRDLALVLDALRVAIAAAPRSSAARPLFGTLSYADITMAQVLAFIAPPAFGLRLGEASRRSFTDPELRGPSADLLAWRDALYEAHRPRARP